MLMHAFVRLGFAFLIASVGGAIVAQVLARWLVVWNRFLSRPPVLPQEMEGGLTIAVLANEVSSTHGVTFVPAFALTTALVFVAPINQMAANIGLQTATIATQMGNLGVTAPSVTQFTTLVGAA